MAATCLAEGTYVLRNVPDIADVDLHERPAGVDGHDGHRAPRPTSSTIDHPPGIVPEAPYELVERMRASIVVLGPLLARFGRARVALPGGDDFGPRPIDMHLRGLEQLGAALRVGPRLHRGHRPTSCVGTRILLEFPSVGATENALMAAVLAKGTTVIDNAAREPEIADLRRLPQPHGRPGARAPAARPSPSRASRTLPPVEHTVVPDRIEAATFLAALGVAGGEITLAGARADHMDMLVQKLGEMGMRISPEADGLWAMAPGRLRAVDVSTLPYPGLATDYKPFFVAMLATGRRRRHRHREHLLGPVPLRRRAGAHGRRHPHRGPPRGRPGRAALSGAPVRAHDIRAGAALVVAALAAEGETVVSDADHIDRGYEGFVEKLAGARRRHHPRLSEGPIEPEGLQRWSEVRPDSRPRPSSGRHRASAAGTCAAGTCDPVRGWRAEGAR